MMSVKIAAAAFILSLAASSAALQSNAAAQTANVTRVRGSILGLDGATLHVQARGGVPVTVKLTDGVKLLAVDRKSIDDVKPGTFVGITAVPEPDGTQKAVEIHIFPEALRGLGEGHRPWDLMPNSTMTNANVASAVERSDGKELVLKYKDGEKKFIVPANVEIVTFIPATISDLKPGESVYVVGGGAQADGAIPAERVVVGHNGVRPPM
jgi:outer membrane lipoprotein SlyB